MSTKNSTPPTPIKSLAGRGFWGKLSQVRDKKNHTLQIQHAVNSGGGARGRRQAVFTILNVTDTQFDPILLADRKIGIIDAPLKAGRDVQESELKSLIAQAKKGDRNLINLGHDMVLGHNQIIQQAYPQVFPDAKGNHSYKPSVKKVAKKTSSSTKPERTIQPSASKGTTSTDAPTSKKDEDMTTYDDIDLSILPKIPLEDLCDKDLIHRLMEPETCIVALDDDSDILQVAISKPLLNERFGAKLKYVLPFDNDAKIEAFVGRYQTGSKTEPMQIGSARADTVAGSEIIIGPIDKIYEALSNETKRDWEQMVDETEAIISAAPPAGGSALDNNDATGNDANNTNDNDTPADDGIDEKPTVDLTEFANSNSDNAIAWTDFGVRTTKTAESANQASGFQFIKDRNGIFGVMVSPKLFGGLSQDEISKAGKHTISDMTVYRKELKAEVQNLKSLAIGKSQSISCLVFPISVVPTALSEMIQKSPNADNTNDNTTSDAGNGKDDTTPDASNARTASDKNLLGDFSVASKTRLEIPSNFAEMIARKNALRSQFAEMVKQLQDNEYVAEIPVGDAQVHVSSNPKIVENIGPLAEYFGVQVQYVAVEEDATQSTPSQWQGAFEQAVTTGDLVVFSTPDNETVIVSSSPDFYRRIEKDFQP